MHPGKLDQVVTSRCIAAVVHQDQCVWRVAMQHHGFQASPHVSQGIMHAHNDLNRCLMGPEDRGWYDRVNP